KRIWMQANANTTYVHYTYVEGTKPLSLVLETLVNYRDHHQLTRAVGQWMRVEPVGHGVRVVASNTAIPFHIFSQKAKASTRHEWYRDFFLRLEEERGLDRVEDHLNIGDFHGTLEPGETLSLIFSTDVTPNLNGDAALEERRAHALDLIRTAGLEDAPQEVQQLVLAADQFVVQRALAGGGTGYTIIAGYHWFADWGRDTMIALPGLTLATGRPQIARGILKTFAGMVDQGMLPNNFTDTESEPGYNTVDATLWFFEALRAYYAATHDDSLLRELFPVLQDIIAWHERGTRYGIRVDPADGLLHAGEPGSQLTWMDVKLGDWVVTPRVGKPVEINALWYNALSTMADFSKALGEPAAAYTAAADRVAASFDRFWNAEREYCYDVIDGPQGDDATLRPNQIIAVALPHSPLTPEQQRNVVDICEQELLTPFGLRSLAPEDPAFVPHYRGDQRQRDAAYHQGTVWAWLIGPFVSAHLRVYGDVQRAEAFLEPLLQHVNGQGLGTIDEIFDAVPPHTPRGCIAQAWSVAEVLRVWRLLHPEW
ncbi:MAG: glycogen debranching enzyme N-terminal domain-containing protein, partial [Anaerolineae bacterium]|nr:glycogen debranching enzyme N-terminal domain-containing protein [Anaerolineae bacterium]